MGQLGVAALEGTSEKQSDWVWHQEVEFLLGWVRLDGRRSAWCSSRARTYAALRVLATRF